MARGKGRCVIPARCGWMNKEDYRKVRKIERSVNLAEKKAKRCPRCKAGYIKIREGIHGAFWRCSNYPTCTYTKTYKQQ